MRTSSKTGTNTNITNEIDAQAIAILCSLLLVMTACRIPKLRQADA